MISGSENPPNREEVKPGQKTKVTIAAFQFSSEPSWQQQNRHTGKYYTNNTDIQQKNVSFTALQFFRQTLVAGILLTKYRKARIHMNKYTQIQTYKYMSNKQKPLSNLILHPNFFRPATTSTATGKDRISFEIRLLKSSLMTCILQSVIVLDLDLETWNARGCLRFEQSIQGCLEDFYILSISRCSGKLPLLTYQPSSIPFGRIVYLSESRLNALKYITPAIVQWLTVCAKFEKQDMSRFFSSQKTKRYDMDGIIPHEISAGLLKIMSDPFPSLQLSQLFLTQLV